MSSIVDQFSITGRRQGMWWDAAAMRSIVLCLANHEQALLEVIDFVPVTWYMTGIHAR